MDNSLSLQDLDMELCVISAILFDPDNALPMAKNILSSDDFYGMQSRKAYDVILELANEKRHIDLMTLKAKLSDHGLMEKIISTDYLASLAQNITPSANVRYYSEQLRSYSEKRRMIASLRNMMTSPERLTEQELQNVLDKTRERQYVKSYAEKSIKAIDEYKRNMRVKKDKIYTGFKVLDWITSGLRIPSMASIGAYPSVGKTAFALNVASNQIGGVVFFSLEMSREQIYERIASAELCIDYGLFQSQSLSDDQYYQAEAYMDVLAAKSFHVFDAEYYVEQHESIIASIKPRLVIVDYVQKVRTHAKVDCRRLEIDHISSSYKRIANTYNCVVMLLSQLSRPDKGITKPENFRPTMTNLKESGALEADSDYVGILHRPYVLCKDKPNEVKPEDGYILVDKNKYGKTGKKCLYFNGMYQKFFEVDKTEHNSGFISGEILDDGPTPFDEGE